MIRGLMLLIFMIMIVIIVFLAFQVNENAGRCRENHVSNQDRITLAGRLLLQSATQQHPLFAHEHAQEAKFIVDDILQTYGSVSQAEKQLKLPRGELERLKTTIYDQFSDKQAFMNERIIDVYKELDVTENEAAGLKRKKKRNRKYPPTSSAGGDA